MYKRFNSVNCRHASKEMKFCLEPSELTGEVDGVRCSHFCVKLSDPQAVCEKEEEVSD